MHSVAPAACEAPPHRGQGLWPQPCLRSPNSGQRMPISPDSWRLLSPANCSFLQITPSNEIWAGLCKFRGVCSLLLAGARARPRQSARLQGVMLWKLWPLLDLPAPPFLLLHPLMEDGSGREETSFPAVSRSPGVKCDEEQFKHTISTSGPGSPHPEARARARARRRGRGRGGEGACLRLHTRAQRGSGVRDTQRGTLPGRLPLPHLSV